jgi:hypothetical protein
VDPQDFEPDEIENQLTPERYEALQNGDSATPGEVELWVKEKTERIFEDEGGWYHFYLWRVALPEETIYFKSLHGDGGYVDGFEGPFPSEEAALGKDSNLQLNPRNEPLE